MRTRLQRWSPVINLTTWPGETFRRILGRRTRVIVHGNTKATFDANVNADGPRGSVVRTRDLGGSVAITRTHAPRAFRAGSCCCSRCSRRCSRPVTFSAGPASAAEVDTTNTRTAISGNVQLDGEPLEGVTLNIDGPGATRGRDRRGPVAVGVPERNAEYVVTLDEETLPEGIAVVEEEDDTPNVKEVTGRPRRPRHGELLHRRGRAQRHELLRPVRPAHLNGLSFGLMLALAAIGLSLVFGTTGISNFAHAEMVTFGAIAALGSCTGASRCRSGSAIPIAVVLSAAFGLGSTSSSGDLCGDDESAWCSS